MTHLNLLGRSFFKLAFITVFAVGFQACTNTPKTEDPEKVADEQNDDKFEKKDQENDADFLVKAAEINMTEVGLSRVALQKSTAADVKTLAQMMIDDHTKGLSDVKALGDKMGATVPLAMTDDADKAVKDLNEKTGADLDKEYCDKMVKGHKDAIDLFEKRAEKTENGDLKTYINQTLPGLRKHLEHAEACQEKYK